MEFLDSSVTRCGRAQGVVPTTKRTSLISSRLSRAAFQWVVYNSILFKRQVTLQSQTNLWTLNIEQRQIH